MGYGCCVEILSTQEEGAWKPLFKTMCLVIICQGTVTDTSFDSVLSPLSFTAVTTI
jgi:hypothetical protein